MHIIISILVIFLMVSQVNGSCSTGSKEMDAQCSTYCYQVVEPLLQYVGRAGSKIKQFSELQDKIVNLNGLLRNKDLQLTQQIELNLSYKKLNQNLIVQNKHEIENLLLKVNLKNQEIINLQSKIKSKNQEINDMQSKENFKNKVKNVFQSEVSSKYSQLFEDSENINQIEDKITVNNTKAEAFTVVPCDSKWTGSEWTVIQRRMDGTVNFNRNWSEYKEGFGNMSGEFFIGLDKLHMLTQSQPHELYISLMDFSNETRYARYGNFAIGSEEEFYKLKEVGSYSGNAGDALHKHKNMPFATPDRDQEDNCAEMFSSGWWFSKCYFCNLNGLYVQKDTEEGFQIIEWVDWKHRPLKCTQMMINPKSG